MSIADTQQFETLAVDCADKVANLFSLKMIELFVGMPTFFEGRSTRAQWWQQVDDAEQRLADVIKPEILRAITQIEMDLHDGQFLKNEPTTNGACPVCGVHREPGDAPHLGFRCGCWQR